MSQVDGRGQLVVIDAELAKVLELPFANSLDDVEGTRAEQALAIEDELARRAPPPDGVTWSDRSIPTTDGHALTVRLYRNERVARPAGVTLFFHGGAFVFGGLESEHERCLRYCADGECDVVSVDYRLAPEHPYPAAHDDARDALAWVRASTTDLNVDPARVVVAGASAGGCLAALATQWSRHDGHPPLAGQLLVYPATDDRTDSTSMASFYEFEPWDGRRSQQMWRIYLKGKGGDDATLISPARAIDLAGLPPTYLMAAEADPLRDEAVAYATRMMEAGVSVELHVFAHAYHGFDVVAPGSRLSEAALTEQAAALKRLAASR